MPLLSEFIAPHSQFSSEMAASLLLHEGLGILDLSLNQVERLPAKLAQWTPHFVDLSWNPVRNVGPDAFNVGAESWNVMSLDLSGAEIQFLLMMDAVGMPSILSLYLENATVHNDYFSSILEFVNYLFPNLHTLSVCGVLESPVDLSVIGRFSYLQSLDFSGAPLWPKDLSSVLFGPRPTVRVVDQMRSVIDTMTCYDLEGLGAKRLVQFLFRDSDLDYAFCSCKAHFYGSPPSCQPCGRAGLSSDLFDCPGPARMDRRVTAWNSSEWDDWRNRSGLVFAAHGHWMTPPTAHSADAPGLGFPFHFLPCRDWDAPWSPCSSSQSDPSIRCAAGYEARLCSRCSSGFYALGTGGHCAACPTSSAWTVVWLLFQAVFGVGLVLYSFFATKSSSGFSKILLNFVQMLPSVTRLPPLLGTVHRGASSLLSLSPIGPECVVSGFGLQAQFAVAVVTPLAVVLLTGLIFGAGWRLRAPKWAARCLRSLVFLEYLTFFPASWWILSVLVCERDPGDGVHYFLSHPHSVCSTSWRAWSLVLTVLFVFGLPVTALGLSFRFPTSMALSVLGASYVDGRRQWEWMVVGRRILFAAAFLFLRASVLFRGFWVSCVLLAALVAQVVVRPYRSWGENAAEMTALVLLTLNEAVTGSNVSSGVEGTDAVLTVLLVVNALFGVVLFGTVLFFSGFLRRAVRALTRAARSGCASIHAFCHCPRRRPGGPKQPLLPTGSVSTPSVV